MINKDKIYKLLFIDICLSLYTLITYIIWLFTRINLSRILILLAVFLPIISAGLKFTYRKKIALNQYADIKNFAKLISILIWILNLLLFFFASVQFIIRDF